jgi:glycosyltransferase involved in cell wall biosynthesis
MGIGRRFLQMLFSPLMSYIVPRCAGVIAVSPPIVQRIRQRYHIPEVTLIRNIPEYRVVQKSDRLRSYLGLGSNVRIAVYQGNLQPDRGLEVLVHAAPFLDRNIVVVMMGQDMIGTKGQLEELIECGGWADRVKIIPPVPYDELLSWTASADIGLVVSSPCYSLNIQILLPNKLFEFLMAGLPVLSTPLEAIVEVIQKYDVGQIMSSLGPAEIGKAINTMMADPEALIRMSHNALRAAQQELNWEKEKQHLTHLYSRCCV